MHEVVKKTTDSQGNSINLIIFLHSFVCASNGWHTNNNARHRLFEDDPIYSQCLSNVSVTISLNSRESGDIFPLNGGKMSVIN